MVKHCLAFVAVTVFYSGVASAEPIDTWETTHGIDCLTDPYNPIREDGTRDPDGDPLPGSDAWGARDGDHTACTKQRDHDARLNPWRNVGSLRYGEDMYRQPVLWDNVRFHFDDFPAFGIPGVPSAEMFRPCSNAPGDCPDLPAGLERFDPPYPVVVVFHGIIAQASHHRFITQSFAERGYMAIGVNGTLPLSGGPNSQRTANGNDVLEWLASPASGIYGQQADLSRVGFAGHSQGGAATQSYQGDPRIHAMLVYDAGDAISAANVSQPTMFQRTDGGFATAQGYPSNYPATRHRARPGYNALKSRGVDVMNFTARSSVHTDWNGYGVGLAGNRLIELLINYYGLAWFDRHLQGRLVFDGAGNVVTSGGRTEAEERAYRQQIAEDAFDRLTARYFDDSADIHNISMGWWDPELAVTSGDPLFGGNVPFSVAGTETRDRFSYYYQSVCSVTLPNYVAGGTGQPDDPVPPKRRADTGEEGDMRFVGCPELELGPPDTSPDPFGFTDVLVDPDTIALSETVSVTGITAPVLVSMAGHSMGRFRVNGGEWRRAGTTVQAGDTVQLRLRSDTEPETDRSVILTVGDFSTSWMVSTGSVPSFSFTDVSQAADTVALSETVTIDGLSEPRVLSMSGHSMGRFRVNGGEWRRAGLVVNNGDELQLRLRADPVPGTPRAVTVEVGGYSTSWTVTAE
jgi:hypothetical protein